MRDEGGAELTPAGAFAFLPGRWQVERVIRGQAVIEGVLIVLRLPDGHADWAERVSVRTTQGAEFGASQRYRVKQTREGFVLCFGETGDVFEEVSFVPDGDGALRAEAAHRCGEDWYQSFYVLGPGRRFTIEHVVTGPRKNYVSDTTFCATP